MIAAQEIPINFCERGRTSLLVPKHAAISASAPYPVVYVIKAARTSTAPFTSARMLALVYREQAVIFARGAGAVCHTFHVI